MAALLLVLASPPPAAVALKVGVKPTSAGLGVIGTLIVLLPLTGMGVLLTQVAVLVREGIGRLRRRAGPRAAGKAGGAVIPGGQSSPSSSPGHWLALRRCC